MALACSEEKQRKSEEEAAFAHQQTHKKVTLLLLFKPTINADANICWVIHSHLTTNSKNRMASRNRNFTLLFFLLALLMANSCFSLPLAPNADIGGDEEIGTSAQTQPAEEPTTTSAAGTDESTTTESSPPPSTTSEPYPFQVVENTDSTPTSTDEPTTTAAEEPSTTTAVEQTESTTTAVTAADEPAAATDASSTSTVEPSTTTEQASESTPTTEAAESTTVDAREANLESTFHAIDSNGDEELSPEEVFDFLSQRKMLSKSQAQRALNSEAFQEFFRSIDQDQDGQLSLAEVRPVVENYANYEDAIMKVVFEMVDEDNDGLINYEEFIDAYAERSGLDYEQRNELSHNETSRQQFARMDINGDEGIDLDELKASLKGSPESTVTSSTEASTTPDSEEPSSSTDEPSSIPSSTTSEEPPASRRSLADFIFAAVDQDFNGQISYNEQIDFLATLLYDSYRQRDDLAKDELALRQFYGADRDNNGELNFEEFMAQIVPQQQPVDEPTTTEQAEDDVTKQLEMLTQYFRTADADRNGQLDVDEFADFFAIAMRLPEEQKELLSQSPFLQQLFQQVDEDQNGGISLFELTSAFAGNGQQQSEQLAQVAFALVDADQDGCVTVDEAAHFAAQMTGTDKDQWLQDPRLREAFKQVDTNGDDRVSFDEWMEAVKNNDGNDQQQQEKQSVSKFNLKAALFAF